MGLLLQNFLNAVEQLWANKMRSVLTVLGVIIAVTSTLVVVSVVQGFSGYVTTFLQGLGTNTMWVVPEIPRTWDATTSKAEMLQGDIDEVSQSCTAIKRLAPFVARQVKVKHEDREIKAELQGTTPDFQQIRNFNVEVGRCFGEVELTDHRQVCVLGREVVRDFNMDEGIMGSTVTIMNKPFRVIGILEKKGSF